MTLLALVIIFLIWGVLHSLTAALSFKRWVRRWAGERVYQGWYRLGYNLLASITFLPVLYLFGGLFFNRVLWQIPWHWNLLTIMVQVIGAAGVVVSLAQTDFWQFAGVEQVIRY